MEKLNLISWERETKSDLPSTEFMQEHMAEHPTDLVMCRIKATSDHYLWDVNTNTWCLTSSCYHVYPTTDMPTALTGSANDAVSMVRNSDRTKSEMGSVTSLGSGKTKYPTDYDPSVLQTFKNKHPDNEYIVTFDAYEFRSLCPVTLQPDYAKMVISYIPNDRMVESKSLKLYLFSFANHGSFHEDCVNTIMKDLVNLMHPKYLEVRGIFAPRGGISIFPYATYADEAHKGLERARQLEMLKSASDRAIRFDM